MKTAEVTLYRCYWPPAHTYLKGFGVEDFISKAYDLLMTLEVDVKHAYEIASLLPTGAVVDIIETQELLEPQDIDELLFYQQDLDSLGADKN